MAQSFDHNSKPLSLTETRNPRTTWIDRQSTAEVVRLFLAEDRSVASAVETIAPELTRAIDLIFDALGAGGRLVYLGAGTSGRLGILDGSELPPTFGVPPEIAVALIAGGPIAVTHAVEGAEDDEAAALHDLKAMGLKAPDLLLGISASGLTPYVRSGLEFAARQGCRNILLTCNPRGPFPSVDVLLNPVVGPEVITGSTRLKSGTACKMVLNLLSSGAMIKSGKVYQNLMVDVRATNAKLRDRAIRIVAEAGQVSRLLATDLLGQADGEAKVAIFLARKGGTPALAREIIANHRGLLYRALGESENPAMESPVTPPPGLAQNHFQVKSADLEDAIAASVRYLASDAAAASLAANVYWPKWNSPWWHMTLLHEMGEIRRVPARVIRVLVDEVRRQMLDWFPFKIGDVPAGVDPILNIGCHCQMGTLYQILFSYGLDVDAEIPWIRPWFLRYQMPDGGLNCDEEAYTRLKPKSSIVSTLPVMEAVLNCTRRPFSKEEADFLDRGAQYLVNHRLFRSQQNPERIIDEAWTRLIFPRFYNYDFLRGLAFLRNWAFRRSRPLPENAFIEAEKLLCAQLDPQSGYPVIGFSCHTATNTRSQDVHGAWTKKQPASSFPLLELVRQPGQTAPWLKPSADLALGILPAS